MPWHGVEGFEIHGGRVTAVRTSAGDLPCGTVVVAAGAWSGQLLETDRRARADAAAQGADRAAARRSALDPAASSSTARTTWSRATTAGSWSVPPRKTSGFDTQPDLRRPPATCSIVALRLCPVLSQAEVEATWAGLRPGSVDTKPYIGPAPGFENLIVATGHKRAGLQLAPATAELVADLVLGRPPRLDFGRSASIANPNRIDGRSLPVVSSAIESSRCSRAGLSPDSSCSGRERRDDRVLAVADHAAIRAGVVGAIEHGLQRQGNIRIAGQERNGDPRQSLLQPDRIDEEVARPVEAVDADVIVERSGLLDGEALAERPSRACPAPEQVDLDQMGLAGEDLTLLGQVLPARVARSLVGRAEDLDRGDQPILRSIPSMDLDERLLVRVVLDRLDRDDHGLGQLDLLGDGDASAVRLAGANARVRNEARRRPARSDR